MTTPSTERLAKRSMKPIAARAIPPTKGTSATCWPIDNNRSVSLTAGLASWRSDVYQSLEIAHRAYVLENGTVALSGDARTLMDDDGLRRSYLGM